MKTGLREVMRSAAIVFAAVLAATGHDAARAQEVSREGKVQGAFSLNDRVLEPKYVYVFPADGSSKELVFTTHPLAIGLPYLENGGQTALEAEAKEGCLVLKLSLNDEGEYNGHVLAGGSPQIFVTGVISPTLLTLQENSERRVAGTWKVEEPVRTLNDTYRFDLTFDAEVADPAGRAKALPPGGGSPGKAYLEFVENVRAGKNIEAMRRFTKLGITLTPQRTEEELREDIEFFRARTPAEASVTGGLVDEHGAVLYVDSTSPEGAKEKLRVSLTQTKEGWELAGWTVVQ